jgi:hypothetical protein
MAQAGRLPLSGQKIIGDPPGSVLTPPLQNLPSRKRLLDMEPDELDEFFLGCIRWVLHDDERVSG